MTPLTMAQSIATLGVCVVAFASTNIDDVLLLSAFFSDPRYTRRQVIPGSRVLEVASVTIANGGDNLGAPVAPAYQPSGTGGWHSPC